MSKQLIVLEEKIKAQEEKLKQLKALKQKKESRAKAAEVKKERADDTRRKILIGAMYLERFKSDAEAKAKMLNQLDRFLTRPADRALFDLVVEPRTENVG